MACGCHVGHGELEASGRVVEDREVPVTERKGARVIAEMEGASDSATGAIFGTPCASG